MNLVGHKHAIHDTKYSITPVGSLPKIGSVIHFVCEEIEAQKGT